MPEPYWSDGTVTLFLGDCREITDWLEGDVLVTDPLYGVHHSPRGTRGSNAPVLAGELRTGRAADRELGPEHVALPPGCRVRIMAGTPPGESAGPAYLGQGASRSRRCRPMAAQ